MLVTLGKFLLPAAAVSMTVFGLAENNSAQANNGSAPITCEFDVSTTAFGTTYRGIVHANEDVDGIYKARFQTTGASSANIKQSGAFSLDAGESATLGQAGFGGSPNVAAELTLTVNGQTLVCHNGNPIKI